MAIRSLTESEVEDMKSSKVWSEDCPLHYTKLSVVEIDYLGFDGELNSSGIVVLSDISVQVESIFEKLLAASFPIERVSPMEEFNGDDVAAMEANNSSAFNGRKIMNTDRWSSHAYGCAIDINPTQNPYLLLDQEHSQIKVYPTSGIEYVNRNSIRKGMVESIVSIFSKYGFTDWGGDWEHKPDYHHFQLPWDKIKELV